MSEINQYKNKYSEIEFEYGNYAKRNIKNLILIRRWRIRRRKGKEPFRPDEERSRHGLCPWIARKRKLPRTFQSTLQPSPFSIVILQFLLCFDSGSEINFLSFPLLPYDDGKGKWIIVKNTFLGLKLSAHHYVT